MDGHRESAQGHPQDDRPLTAGLVFAIAGRAYRVDSVLSRGRYRVRLLGRVRPSDENAKEDPSRGGVKDGRAE